MRGNLVLGMIHELAQDSLQRNIFQWHKWILSGLVSVMIRLIIHGCFKYFVFMSVSVLFGSTDLSFILTWNKNHVRKNCVFFCSFTDFYLVLGRDSHRRLCHSFVVQHCEVQKGPEPLQFHSKAFLKNCCRKTFSWIFFRCYLCCMRNWVWWWG